VTPPEPPSWRVYVTEPVILLPGTAPVVVPNLRADYRFRSEAEAEAAEIAVSEGSPVTHVVGAGSLDEHELLETAGRRVP
jgi:hypothetical protein